MPEYVMKNGPAKTITEDALFCSLVVALFLVLAPLFGAAGNFFGMAIAALFACLNQKKSHLRVLCISAVLFLSLAIFSSPYQLVSQYMWAILTGLVTSRLLHLRRVRYYALSFVSLFALQLAKIVLTITLLTPMTVTEYVMRTAEQVPQLPDFSAGPVFAALIALFYAVAKAALQCAVVDRFHVLYRRFVPQTQRNR